MAQRYTRDPTTWEELFDEVYETSKRYNTTKHFKAFIRQRIEIGRHIFPFMAKKTVKDFYDYHFERNRPKFPDPSKPGITAAQFWKAGYDFNPLARHDHDLVEMFATDTLERIPLGKIVRH